MAHESAIRWPAASSAEWTLTVVTPRPDTTDQPVVDLSHLPDQELVARTLAGEPTAFDVLVERHRRTVYHVCYRFTPNHEDASDLAQDVFVRAWRGLARFKGEAAFSTWLYRIAVNACLNKVSARAVALEPIDDPDRFEDERADRPGAALLRGERADAVRQAIRALPPKQRATLVLRVYHELSHQEIARVLGSSVGAAKANFFHALGNLKRLLGGEP